ncbi:MAG TPA: tetratricopeptide repeat protein [Gemmatimonadales bacterium]|nr:tetratricopeptide repeat protein [Gemmatimonadales bacterium]
MTPSSGDPGSTLRELVRSGRFAEALATFRASASDRLHPPPEFRLLAATAATRLGDLGAAGELARGALEGFRARGDRDGRMRSLNLLGVIEFERGRLEEAEAAFGQALGLARELADTQMAAHVSNNLGSVNHLRGRAEEALSLYREALVSHQRLGDRRGTAETWHNLGLAFRQMGWWREAEDAVAEAMRHAEAVGDGTLLALAVTGHAELRVDRGQLALVEQELDRADRLATAARDEIGAAEVRRIRALVALRRGEPAAALSEAEAARAAAVANGVALLSADCTALVALALRQLGRREEAEARHAEASGAYRALGAVGLEERLAREWAAFE